MGGRDHSQTKIFYIFVYKKHREKAESTGKTQGKHREFCLDWNVATLNLDRKRLLTYFENVTPMIFLYFRHISVTVLQMGGTWDHGLLGCFDNIGICIAAFIAPCWVAVSLIFLIFTDRISQSFCSGGRGLGRPPWMQTQGVGRPRPTYIQAPL